MRQVLPASSLFQSCQRFTLLIRVRVLRHKKHLTSLDENHPCYSSLLLCHFTLHHVSTLSTPVESEFFWCNEGIVTVL